MKTETKLFHVSCQVLLLGRKATIRNRNGRKPAYVLFCFYLLCCFLFLAAVWKNYFLPAFFFLYCSNSQLSRLWITRPWPQHCTPATCTGHCSACSLKLPQLSTEICSYAFQRWKKQLCSYSLIYVFYTSHMTALSYIAHALLPWRWPRANSKIV